MFKEIGVKLEKEHWNEHAMEMQFCIMKTQSIIMYFNVVYSVHEN